MNPFRLTPQHAAQYRNLMLEAYERHPDAFTSSAEERSVLPMSWWEERLSEIESPKEIVFGSFVNGELAGVAGLAFERREKARHKTRLFGMYVANRFRNLGLGDRLLGQAISYAKSRPGVILMQLTVTLGNHAAESLYQRHGFVRFGLEPYAVAVGRQFVSKLHLWRKIEHSNFGQQV